MKTFLAKSRAVKAHLRWSERRLCRSLVLARATYRRWQRRQRRGQELISRPGPKKVGPLPLQRLNRELAALPHRFKRTPGSGALRARYAVSISRRQFDGLLHRCRSEQRRARRQSLRRVTWHAPNVAWALDGAEYGPDGQCQMLLFVATQDLASGHRFAPLPALQLTGEQVAQYLEGLFEQHGPPLILKRDNGSIFNNQAVDEVLARWQVLPLNSPARCPRYNGAIEKAIGELKADLPSVLASPPAWRLAQVQPVLAALCLQHNTKPRRRLDGRTACEVYGSSRTRFAKRERLAIFESILSDAHARVSQMEEPTRRDVHTAWREAVVHWLVCQHLISLSQNPKCVTQFPQNVGS